MLVEPGGRFDPVCTLMRASPLPSGGLPGPPVLGFVACGAIVRTAAYLDAGGFHPRSGIGGEEDLLALDLATRGWACVYADDLVAHHAPHGGPRPARGVRQGRNAAWTAWLRRPLPTALGRTARLLAGGADGVRALREVATGAPWLLRERRVVPRALERQLRLVERGSGS